MFQPNLVQYAYSGGLSQDLETHFKCHDPGTITKTFANVVERTKQETYDGTNSTSAATFGSIV